MCGGNRRVGEQRADMTTVARGGSADLALCAPLVGQHGLHEVETGAVVTTDCFDVRIELLSASADDWVVGGTPGTRVSVILAEVRHTGPVGSVAELQQVRQ